MLQPGSLLPVAKASLLGGDVYSELLIRGEELKNRILGEIC